MPKSILRCFAIKIYNCQMMAGATKLMQFPTRARQNLNLPATSHAAYFKEEMSSDIVRLGDIIHSAVDFLFPRRCLVCGKINPKGKYAHFCDDCAPEADILRGARCLRCSEIIGGNSAFNVATCPHCSDNPPFFDRSLVAGSFANALRQMVIELKYKGGTYLLSDISLLLKSVDTAQDFFENSVLVPVPLHFTRHLKRGYNQSAAICAAITKAFPNSNIRIAEILRRVRRTPTQTTLDKGHREKNVKDAFRVAGAKVSTPAIQKDARIIVVDDVMTSSATLSECARVLKISGFCRVDAFALARRL